MARTRGAVLGVGAVSVVLAASVLVLGWPQASLDRSGSGHHGNHESAAVGRIGPKIAVLRFVNLNRSRVHAHFVDGITQQVVQDLARFRDLIVVTNDAAPQVARRASLVQGIAGSLGADYLLDGTVLRSNRAIRVTARLYERITGTLIWTEDFERAPSTEHQLRDMAQISGLIASRIGQAHGVVNRRETVIHLHRDSQRAGGWRPTPYECVLKYYEQRNGDARRTRNSVRRCLQRTVQSHSAYATAWAALSWIYLEQSEAGTAAGGTADELLEKALAAAERAVQLDPTHALTHRHLAKVLLRVGRVDQAKREDIRAVTLNPNDPDVLAAAGTTFAFTGDPDFAESLIRKAIRMNPGLPPWYHGVLAVIHYRRKEYGKALERARSYGHENNLLGCVLIAASAGQLGRRDRALEAIRKLRSEFPDFAQDPRAPLERWRMGDDIIARFMEGLQKAGLRIAPVENARRS